MRPPEKIYKIVNILLPTLMKVANRNRYHTTIEFKDDSITSVLKFKLDHRILDNIVSWLSQHKSSYKIEKIVRNPDGVTLFFNIDDEIWKLPLNFNSHISSFDNIHKISIWINTFVSQKCNNDT